MDRKIVWAGQIPLDTDLLYASRYAMTGLAMLTQAVLGTTTCVDGLACTPTSPATMAVQVGAGSIYMLGNIDGTAYGGLAADTAHSIMKQGILLDPVTLNTAAPGTAGQSINYLIQATYQDSDTDLTVLPYYNSSNPASAYSGPNNTGTSQATRRAGTVVLSAKAGTAATTGSQTTPAPDAGYVGLYVVTVANGAASVTSGNISTYGNAPFIGNKLMSVPAATMGRCRLSISGGNVVLKPYQGNTVFIPGTGPMTIPSAGISFGIGATLVEGGSMLANTTYYAYVCNVNGVLTLQPSATAHATDTSTGCEIRSGDSTRAVVGMFRVGAGPAFSTAALGCLSWFNRATLADKNVFSATRSPSTTTAYGEINSEIQVGFLTWGDETPDISAHGIMWPPNSATSSIACAIGIDSTSTGEPGAAATTGVNPTTNMLFGFALRARRTLSEGWHFATLLGKSNNASAIGSWAGTSSNIMSGAASANDVCQLSVSVRG